MKPFTENVIQIIKQIPPGKVMTYGQIAKIAGSPRGARQVVRVLHSMSKKYDLPWHRVLNVKGEISMGDEEFFITQKTLLEQEGIVFNGENKVDMEMYRYQPDDEWTV